MVIKAAAFSYSDQRASDPELHVSSQNMSHTHNPPHDVLAGMPCIRRAAGARFLHFRNCVNPAGRIALQARHHQISIESHSPLCFLQHTSFFHDIILQCYFPAPGQHAHHLPHMPVLQCCCYPISHHTWLQLENSYVSLKTLDKR